MGHSQPARTDTRHCQDDRLHLDPGPLVVVLVLLAAVMHATWNAVAHAATVRVAGFGLISLSTFVVGVVLVAVGGPVEWHWFWFAALSASLHVAYVLLLMATYQVADLSRAYPLSRGTGVALTAVASIVLPRSPLGPDVVAGVVLVVTGLVGVTFAGPPLTGRDRRGIATALATGTAIAGYTVIDGLAVSGGAPVLSYGGWLMALHSGVVVAYAVSRRRRAILHLPRRQTLMALGGGVVSVLAYGLVLLAQTSGALAAVAALRELSIAVGVVIGAFVLHEAAARKRLLPAIVLTAGAVVLALSI
jgi:drug/metabolite transporter (DMT)-like permease